MYGVISARGLWVSSALVLAAAPAALELRTSGGTFQPAHPLARIDAIHFAGWT